jgi:hypothetical protein
MYKDIMQKFELPLSRNLIFVLQKERFYCYSEKQPYKQSYEYSYFSHKLQFKGRNKKENIKLIEASLNEIIKHGVGIKSFSRQGEQFHLEYIPITEYEVEDLIHSSSSSDHIFDFASPTSLIEPVNR